MVEVPLPLLLMGTWLFGVVSGFIAALIVVANSDDFEKNHCEPAPDAEQGRG